MMQLIQLFLEQGWRITYASPAADSAFMYDLENIGVQRVAIELNSSSFDEFVAQAQPNMVMFDRFMMEEQFGWRVEKQCPEALRILDTEDLHCLRHARHAALKQKRDMTQADLMSDLAIREVASIQRCDVSLMISEVEVTLLQERFNVSAELLHLCRFMLSPMTPTLEASWLDHSERQHFISIGNFRHAPNWDAVLYLKQSIWPLIRKQLPQAELHVYGAYPPPKATALHNARESFLVKGWAENAHEVMAQARVCLAPIRFGAGIKGKLIDAMQCGTPSVTTTIGAEGMNDDLPWSGGVTDDPSEFAQQAVRLYKDESYWRHKQCFGAPIINQCYSAAAIGGELIERLNALQANLDTHRLNNFTGAMLRHHTMNSFKYMSQWIEAKNKRPPSG